MAGLSFEQGSASNAQANKAFKSQLNKVYTWYTGGFISFVIVLAILHTRMDTMRELQRRRRALV